MTKFCSECGVEMADKTPQCRSCGAIQSDFVYKSRVAAGALALFTGMFGIHRFYLGQWWGVFYLLFFWTYIPSLVGFIEGIVFLATPQKSWNAKYNQGLSLGTEKGGVVIIAPLIFLVIAGIGILAAIALPAYQDYTYRAKLQDSHSVATQLMPIVEEYVQQHDAWPTSLNQLPVADLVTSESVGTVAVNSGVIVVTPAKGVGLSGSLIYVPSFSGSGISWSCTESTVESRYLPTKCR